MAASSMARFPRVSTFSHGDVLGTFCSCRVEAEHGRTLAQAFDCGSRISQVCIEKSGDAVAGVEVFSGA